MYDVKRVAILSQGVLDIPHLQAFLPFKVIDCAQITSLATSHLLKKHQVGAVAGWGRKPSAQHAMAIAQANRLPFITLEDGFLRSVGLGSEGWPPASMVVDDVGVYFDAHHTSALEQIIQMIDVAQPESSRLMGKIVQHKISKYNHYLSDYQICKDGQLNVLIVDQTFGDQSVCCAGASDSDFHRMLSQACIDYPNANIWIKTHPEVSKQIKKGYLSDVKPSGRVRKIVEHVNPIGLLEQMDVVCVVSSHMGFEALMLGKKVYCFGMTWYAGWGLTDDRYAPKHIISQERRHQKKNVVILFEAAYIHYSRYVNPSSGLSCDLEEIVDWLILNREMSHKLEGRVFFHGFSRWKELYLKLHFKLPANKLFFGERFVKPINPDHMIFWGMINKNRYQKKSRHQVQKWVMEDGFIRSVGLGAQLVRPLSVVIDAVGIYYDATQPSALENWYNSHQPLTLDQRQRAQRIRECLVNEGLSKYNVGETGYWPRVPAHKRCILIPGQVEDDASVVLGGVDIRTNLQLIQAVRLRHPDAFIVYKPHPDVAAGLRIGAVDPVQLSRYVDAVVEQLGMPECLSRVDEVHTMTSLTGFEALLRGVSVYCYGLPFYAGWGLTVDTHACVRRQVKLSLDELVYGALVAYPLYMLPQGIGFVQVEQAIHELIKQRHNQPTISQKALGFSAGLRANVLRWRKKLWP